MDNRAIGVFDSGLGGLTTVKELHRILPKEDIIYLGDTGQGTLRFPQQRNDYQVCQTGHCLSAAKGHEMVVAACGTVSSTLPREISANLPVPYLDIVLPAAQQACAMTSRGRIGVVGTNATLRSNAFGKAIHNIRADVQVYGNPCPLLVHLVENGLVQQESHHPPDGADVSGAFDEGGYRHADFRMHPLPAAVRYFQRVAGLSGRP